MQEIYDKHGVGIREFDVVKVFHFIGARRKRHYMYKWIRCNEAGELCLRHLDEDNADLVPISVVAETINGNKVWTKAEIVQAARS